MSKVVTFGEIMGRLSPSGVLRFRQSMPGSLDVIFAGAEASVAASVTYFGGQGVYVTALPRHAIADACIASLKSIGVDTSNILRTDEGRLGLYFLETGANQRPSNVIYDRAGSSVSVTHADAYPWDEIFEGASWFHISGITPALSREAAETALAAAGTAKKHGVTVSCDLNFRAKLWKWDSSCEPRELAEKTMRKLMEYVDVVIGNEEDAAKVLSIHAADTDVDAGKVSTDAYPDVARQVVAQFPNVSHVAITLRESISASHNNWGAMLFEASSGKAFFAPWRDESYQPYQITHIVDRVGGGDSFAAGLIFAMTTPELSDPQTAVSYAVAASCLAHSVQGDFNYNSREEVEKLMKGSGSGRVVR